MNLLVPLEIGLVQGLIMVGAVLTFALAFRLLGFPDLTVEGSVPLGAGIYAVLVRLGAALPLAVAMAGVAGAVAGATTALLHTRFGVNKFLAGIINAAILYSLTLRVMSGPNISLLQGPSLLAASRALFGAGSRLGVLLTLGAAVSLLAVALLLFLGSRTGVKLRAAGSNPRFAESVGVRPDAAVVLGLAGCNSLGALSGVLQADYQGFADVTSGQGVVILALAALATGEALVPQRSVRFHQYVVLAAVAGSIVYHVIVAYAVSAGLAPTDLRLATGVLVLLVIALRFSRNDTALEEIRIR